MSNFGENIFNYRKRLGWSQEEFADEITKDINNAVNSNGYNKNKKEVCYSGKAVSKWERGESFPPLDVVVIQPYKNIVLKKNLQAILDRFNSAGTLEFLSVDEMLEQIFYRSGISGHFRQVEKEKQDFFNKYLKRMKLLIVEKEGTKFYQISVD